MEMTKAQLLEMLDAQIKKVMDADGFSERIKGILEARFKELQENIVKPNPFSVNESKALVEAIGFARIDGDHMITSKGSIFNLKNKSTPWIKVSKEVEEWAKDFALYLKTSRVTKLLASTSDESGGFTVPEEFKAFMVMYTAEATLIWQRATVWPMTTGTLSFPKLAQDPDVDSANFDHFAGVTFAWTEEGGEKEETEPEFGLLELIVHELAGYTEVTNTLLDDSVLNLVNFLTTLFRAAWYWMTDRSFLRGTGGKQPLGIFNDPSVLSVARETAGTVTVDDVINMDTKLPAVFDPGSVWFYSKRVRAAIRGQKSALTGELILQENYRDFADGYTDRLLGRPALLGDGKTSAIGTAGDLVLGNWPFYYVGFRQDFAMDSSRHYKFRNNRTSLRCSGRLDGEASIGQAFVILSDAS